MSRLRSQQPHGLHIPRCPNPSRGVRSEGRRGKPPACRLRILSLSLSCMNGLGDVVATLTWPLSEFITVHSRRELGVGFTTHRARSQFERSRRRIKKESMAVKKGRNQHYQSWNSESSILCRRYLRSIAPHHTLVQMYFSESSERPRRMFNALSKGEPYMAPGQLQRLLTKRDCRGYFGGKEQGTP